MAVRGFQPRKTSTQCTKCGVEWDKDKSNKQKGRALCIVCYDGECGDRTIAKRKWDAEHKEGPNRVELYRDYKMANRKAFYNAINKELKPLKDRKLIREFISKQMDRILNDKQLMEYVSLTNLAEEAKNKKQRI